MIVLLGGTGLLGRQVLRKLLERRYPTRLFVRGSSDWKDASILDLKRKGVELMIADINDPKAIVRSLDGATAVINVVGTMKAMRTADYEGLHVKAVKTLIKAAGKKGIERFIQISCLGAQEDSECEYLKSKWQSECLVKESKFYWTIFRPSFMFGEKFPLLDLLMPLIKFRLCMPIPGSGINAVQPVWADDVADCVVDSIYAKATVSKVYDLGGPTTYQIADIMQMARDHLGIRGPVFNVPSATAAKASSALAKMLPTATLSEDVVRLLMSDSFTKDNALGTKFKARCLPLEEQFDKIMSSY